jgi:hypothetical protein
VSKKRGPTKKQVSLRGETYAKIKQAAEERKQTLTSLVDALCTKFLDEVKP